MPRIPERYAMDEADPTDADGLDDNDMNDQSMNDTDMDEGDGMGEETDPMVAKVFESKQWKDLSSKMDMILQALQGEGGDGMAPGGDGGGPPPMGAGPGDPPPAGPPAPGMDDGMDGMNPEEDERRDHGEQPVQFSGTGFPGPMSTSIPTTGGKKGSMPPVTTGKRYSRQQPQQNDEVIRLKRQLDAVQLKLSRADAEKQIADLEAQGVIFGDTREEAERGRAEETEFLALLTDEDRAQQVDVMKRRYKRRKPDPANPAFPGVARFARVEERNGSAAGAEDFDPEDPQQASEFADLLYTKKMNRAEAVKYMRSKTRK